MGPLLIPTHFPDKIQPDHLPNIQRVIGKSQNNRYNQPVRYSRISQHFRRMTMEQNVGAPSVQEFAGKKIAAGICGILLGSLGIHKFILGLTTPGLIMLLVTLLTCGVGGIVMGVIGLVEGIIYLTKTDDEFYQMYAVEKKGWF
jgi:TM2 domain-containing membrane protein YozV